MKSGRRPRPVFRPRRFWPSALCLLFLAAGLLFSCVFTAFPFFAAVLVATFIGLNEFGRWSYRTNLIICTGTAVAVAVAGVFTWFEVASVFAFFFMVGAYLLYFRDRMGKVVPAFEKFAEAVGAAPDYRSVVETAWEELQEMAPDAAVFIILADGTGDLFLPEHFGERAKRLRRNGGASWKVFASGRAANIGRLSIGRDQPLDRDAASLLAVPISARGEKLGVLQLEAASSGAFSDEDKAKLSLAAMILGHELYMFEAWEVSDEESE